MTFASLCFSTGSLTTEEDRNGNVLNVMRAYAFGYDGASRQTSHTYPNRIETRSVFDPLGRLTIRTLGENTLLNYCYDKSSRITMRNDTLIAYDEVGQLTAYGEDHYTYDPLGNHINSSNDVHCDYNALGALVKKTSSSWISTYAYDAQGYLSQYLRVPISSVRGEPLKPWTHPTTDSGRTQIRFTYDPLGRRLTKHYQSFVVSASNHTTIQQQYHHRYLYAGDNIVAIYDNDTDELLATLLHDESIDTPLSISIHSRQPLTPQEHQHYETLSESEQYLLHQSRIQTYYYHRDHQNSVIALSDKNAQIVEYYEYDAYGTITKEEHLSDDEGKTIQTLNPYRYTGREYDSEDLYYYRARYYDPTLGRFITPDPVGFMGGDTNLYRYVGNDPVNFVDSSGLIENMAGALAQLASVNRGHSDGNPFNGIVPDTSSPQPKIPNSTIPTGKTKVVKPAKAVKGKAKSGQINKGDGLIVNGETPKAEETMKGYFYDYEGKFLGQNGMENVVYAADDKTSPTAYTNPVKLALTHTQFQTASAIVKYEGSTNDKKEYLWIAHASKNAADDSGTTIYVKLMSSYSSVPSNNKTPLPSSSNSDKSNYARSGVIHALLKEDPTNGATLWDGTDFIAWGLHSPNGTPQNKFEEYKKITIDIGIYETYLSNTLLKYPSKSVTYYGHQYSIPDEVFENPSNWTVDKFMYNTQQNASKSLDATGTAGRSIFWKKY